MVRLTYHALGGALVAVMLLGIACGKPTDEPVSGVETASDVVAQVGDRTFTLEDVDGKASSANMKVYQDLYELRRQTVEQMVTDQLLSEEAATRGVSSEQLVADEITGKVRPVADGDVTAFYNQNKARMGGKPLEEMSGQIRAFLTNQSSLQARQRYIQQLRAQSDVEILLDAPRVEVTVAANDPTKGPADARVTIVEFSEFQ